MARKKQWLASLMVTPLGTFIKDCIQLLLAFWAAEVFSAGSIFIPVDKEWISKLVIVCILPNFHVLYNWLNPQYTHYGKGKLGAKIEAVATDPDLN